MSRVTKVEHALAIQALACVCLQLCLSGCGTRNVNPAATQPVTAVNPDTAQGWYWLRQPGSAEVVHADFTVLWQTCEEVARSYLFRIDRRTTGRRRSSPSR